MNRAMILSQAWIAGLALIPAIVPVQGQSPATGQKRSNKGGDQQSLQELDRELLSGLPDAKSTARPETDSAGKDRSPSRFEPMKADHPVVQIAERMRSVGRRMAQHDTSSATQIDQQRIVADIEALLAEAQKVPRSGRAQSGPQRRSSQPGTGTGNASANPPRDSTSRSERGAKDEVEKADAKDVIRRFWGHLPDKLRDPMQASLPDRFLPQYERLIEEYYKRLAEERPAGP